MTHMSWFMTVGAVIFGSLVVVGVGVDLQLVMWSRHLAGSAKPGSVV